MKKFLIIFLVICNALQLAANTANPDIEAANKAYNKEKYNDAITLYNKVLEKGEIASDLYYNLGNCYFRIANYPMAILNYERAKKLNPADADVDFNLKIANTKIIDKIETVPQLFFIRWWTLLSNILSYDNWAIVSLIAISLFFIVLFIYLASSTYQLKKLSFWIGFSMIFVTIFSIHFAIKQYNNINALNQAIIFTPTVTVKSSPDEKGADKFVIHEGTKVILLDELNNWVKISIANGSNGWVEKQCFEII
ncbi:MAG: tetratricopeptide repeat protein [Bacteroidetes bacterium]|nr:tetratricopeptide repeat protein [Bacteroidota bacterium]